MIDRKEFLVTSDSFSAVYRFSLAFEHFGVLFSYSQFALVRTFGSVHVSLAVQPLKTLRNLPASQAGQSSRPLLHFNVCGVTGWCIPVRTFTVQFHIMLPSSVVAHQKNPISAAPTGRASSHNQIQNMKYLIL